MREVNVRGALRSYIAILSAIFVAILVLAFSDGASIEGNLVAWAVLTVLFFLTEYADLYFHDKHARLAVSPSEAILLPMVVVLSFDQVLIGVTIALAAERIARSLGPLKTFFNVASFGCAVAAAGWTWGVLNDGGGAFSLVDGLAATSAIVVFASMTHLFTSIVVSIVEGRSVVGLTRAIGRTTLVNLAGSIILGLFLAASALAAPWTILLFPVGLLALYLGNRAIVAQSRERQRVEHLHAATRALVTGGDLRGALLGFLHEVKQIASADEARAVLLMDGEAMWSGVHADETIADLEPLEDRGMVRLMAQMPDGGGALVVRQDDSSSLAQAIGTTGFVAVPVRESGDTVGLLMVSHRVGAGDFGEAEGRLLEALSAELGVSLAAYRSFAQVADERERFGRIFNSSKEGICLLDLDGVVRAWNPALETITGYAEPELMGRVWSDVVFVRDRHADRVLADGLTRVEPDHELELVTKSGPSRWVTVMSGPVRETDGDGWVVLVRDVSSEHAVEAAKSDFLSTISHELRTPLTTIKGALQVLGRGREKIPEKLHDQMIDVTTRGAERLERLVMNLLLVSQIESNTMNVFTDELALDSLVKEKIAAILAAHPRTEVVLPDEPLVVRADHERTGLAVEHLLDNARKFAGPDGEIRVAVFSEGGFGHVSVADDGPGIPPGDHERIFDRFVRLGDVLTRETQGAGVGLFIARSTIEAMGGRIWVESTIGQGATFHIAVPLAFPVAVPDAAPDAAPGSPGAVEA